MQMLMPRRYKVVYHKISVEVKREWYLRKTRNGKRAKRKNGKRKNGKLIFLYFS